MAQLMRSSVFALKQESTAGTLIKPSAATEFVPLREGFGIEANIEEVSSDELVNDIGASKSLSGKEQPAGSHSVYMKHSETEGTAPEYGLLIESALGAKTVNATEYGVTSGSSAGTSSARAQLTMSGGEEDNFEKGQAVLIKDGTNGYSIRNIYDVDSANNELDLNFNLGSAPASGVNLGKAVLYKPAASGHPSFSAWLYVANGGAIQSVAGCRTSSIEIAANSGEQAEINFSYEGSKFYYNPIVISSSNKYIDFNEGGVSSAVSLTEKVYKNPLDLARAIETAMDAEATGDISVSYSSTTGKYTIASDGATFELEWSTGSNAANSIGETLGFVVSADDTAATSYASDAGIDLGAEYTPTYDDATNLIVKNAELMIGDYSDNICKEAANVSFSISTPTEEVSNICAESGVEEKIIVSREVTASTTLILSKYESNIFDKFVNNEKTPVMFNFGQKSGGNWVAGKCVNIYMANASITNYNVTGDSYAQVELSFKGYITSEQKDIYINFI